MPGLSGTSPDDLRPLRMAAHQRFHGAGRSITSRRPTAVQLADTGECGPPCPGAFPAIPPGFTSVARGSIPSRLSSGAAGIRRSYVSRNVYREDRIPAVGSFTGHRGGRPSLTISSAWPLCAPPVCPLYLFGSCPQRLRAERCGQDAGTAGPAALRLLAGPPAFPDAVFLPGYG
jgi:hypothetical protein